MDRTKGLHPELISRISAVLAEMDKAGHPMKICQGVRTADEQAALYALGRTKPGKKVTNCDGVKLKSNHQPKADNLGYAVDCCFTGPDPFSDSHPWSLYGKMVASHGLTWGGSWISLPDRPHAELPAKWKSSST